MLKLDELFSSSSAMGRLMSKSRKIKSKVSETPPIAPLPSYTLPQHATDSLLVTRPTLEAPPASENQLGMGLAINATSSSTAGKQRSQVADVAPEEDDGLTAEDRMELKRILEKKKARAQARQAEEEKEEKAGSASTVRVIDNSGEMNMVANCFKNTSFPEEDDLEETHKTPQARLRTRDRGPAVDTIKNNAGGLMNGVANVYSGVSYAQGHAAYQRNWGQL